MAHNVFTSPEGLALDFLYPYLPLGDLITGPVADNARSKSQRMFWSGRTRITCHERVTMQLAANGNFANAAAETVRQPILR